MGPVYGPLAHDEAHNNETSVIGPDIKITNELEKGDAETRMRRRKMLAIQSGIRKVHSAVDAPRLTKFFLQAPRCVISGRRQVGIMSAEPVGNYGVRIIFDDLHKTGIYSWDYFHHLGSNKFSLMKNYIKSLKKHGLSRDPPRRR
ncbi:hypothetical protein PanWU01x14_269670 [Parasponia andersonii]|uniref:Gamma-butyrobetaine hydroxylase-like N-terminal domain-containing protein n=1 Tax=Parasponia andersonii TaxID=3476 RepID=A0A2P5B5G3_PARAD|nr:hypothetical protein PanWU01x14_269670 [Parasponia andersonii]